MRAALGQHPGGSVVDHYHVSHNSGDVDEASRALGARSLDAELAECAAVTAPVLIVRGAEDPRPGDGTFALAEALAGSRLRIVEGAGHIPWTERPLQVADVVRSFLSEHL